MVSISTVSTSPRLGVADDALDGRELPAQAVLDRIDQIVHRPHG